MVVELSNVWKHKNIDIMFVIEITKFCCVELSVLWRKILQVM